MLGRDAAGSSPGGTVASIVATVLVASVVLATLNAYNTGPDRPLGVAWLVVPADADADGYEDVVKVTYVAGPPAADETEVSINVALPDGARIPPRDAHAGEWMPGHYETFSPLRGAATVFVVVVQDAQVVLERTIRLAE